MEFYILNGVFKIFKTAPKSEIGLYSLTKLFKQVLNKLNVPYVDPCCVPEGDVIATTRYNVTTGRLEYLSNPETATWSNVPAPALV